MRIELKNFRCYEQYTIDIPDKGLLLLSGISGSGKSTLLNAIVHGFYGKIKKPYTFGKSSCQVNIQFHDIDIQRTNKPNRLIVLKGNQKYEDEQAQSIIENTLGINYEQFVLSSYVSQKSNASIFTYNHNEQIQKIKSIVMSQDTFDTVDYKKHIKDYIKDYHDKILVLKTNVEHTSNQLHQLEREYNQKHTNFEFTQELKKELHAMENIDDKICYLNTYIDDFNSLSQQLNSINKEKTHLYSCLSTYQKEVQEKNILENQIKIEKSNQENKKNTLSEYRKQIQDNPNQEQLIQNLHFMIAYREKQIKLDEHRRKLDTMKTNEIQENENILTQLKSTLIDSKQIDIYNDEIKILNKKIQKARDVQIIKDKIKSSYTHHFGTNKNPNGEDKTILTSIQNNINTVNKQIERLEKLNKQCIIKCPACYEYIKFNKETTHTEQLSNKKEYDTYAKKNGQKDEHAHQVKQYKIQLNKLDSLYYKIDELIKEKQCIVNDYPDIEKTDVQEIQITLSQLNKKIDEHECIQKSVDNLIKTIHENKQGKGFSRSIQYSINELDQLKSELDRYKDDDITNGISGIDGITDLNTITIEDLKKIYIEKKIEHEKHQDLFCKIDQLEHDIRSLQKNIDTLHDKICQYNDIEDKIQDYQKTIAEIDATIQQMNHTYDTMNSNIENVKSYIQTLHYSKTKTKIETQMISLKNDLKEKLNEQDGFVQLKEKYEQAELMALETAIHMFNHYTKFYLDTFFDQEPMIAELVITYQKKKMKSLKIHSSIHYKGNEYDSIYQLSGGEIDRCSLASICGLNTMLNSPFLILDESLSSLDTDKNNEIITFLKDLAHDKLILVCSHEAVEGIFDQIINI